MLESGRLPGAIAFGTPGRGSNHMMPLFMSSPVSGRMTREPNSDSRVCVSATMLPSPSTTQKCVVQLGVSRSPMVASRSW
jgi:hypothetical protein